MLQTIRIAALATLLGAAASGLAFAARPMTAAELRAEIVGKRLCSPKANGLFGTPICFTYRMDGVFEVDADPGQDPRWSFDGDRLCLYKAATPKERRCSTFERISNGRFRMDGAQLLCVNGCDD